MKDLVSNLGLPMSLTIYELGGIGGTGFVSWRSLVVVSYLSQRHASLKCPTKQFITHTLR